MICEICGKNYSRSCASCRKRVSTWGNEGTFLLVEMAKRNNDITANEIKAFTKEHYVGISTIPSAVANTLKTSLRLLGYKGKFVGRIHENGDKYIDLRRRENQSARRWGLKNERCKYCSKTTGLKIHHIVPLSWGGITSDENCITLCEKCHRDIHARLNEHLNRSVLLGYLSDHSEEIKKLAHLSIPNKSV